MTVVREPLVEQPASRITALAADAVLAVICYIAAYGVRFDSADLSEFLPAVGRTMPYVVGSQLLALLAFRAYTFRQGRRWFPRLLAGIFSGAAVGAALIWLTHGFAGVSRISFVVDALLLALAAFGWRGVVGLIRVARSAREERTSTQGMEDRTIPPSVSAGLVGIFRYRELLRNLVLRDIKLKYRGSVFGFFWSLANPLLMVATYTVAFRFLLRIRSEDFVFNLLLGMLTWTFFSASAMMATASVIDSGALIKSVAFPRVILPVAAVLFNLVQFLLAIAVLLPVALAVFGKPLSSSMLLFPVILVLQIVFMTGLAFALATLTAFFRDVTHLMEIALGILFWTTPILYQYEALPELLRVPILLSPMSSFVVAYQQILHQGHPPDLAVWLASGSYAAGMFVVGASMFVSSEDRLAELV